MLQSDCGRAVEVDEGTLSTAELTFLIEKFDQAELYRYEQARELSISLLKEWLVKYKFKDRTWTGTRSLTVDRRLRTRRATDIAKKLSQTERWHSHGRGISMEVLRRDLNLRIEDFGENQERKNNICGYCKLLRDYMLRLGHLAALHRRVSNAPFAFR